MVAATSDAQLIDETLAGKTGAFGELVRKYQDRLYNTLVHVVGTQEEARDVLQEALIQAYLKLATFQRSAAFYTWLYRIALNMAISHRRRRRAVVSVDEVRELTGREPVERGLGPEECLEREERVRQVRSALAALGEEHRAILVLREMEGHAYETIAEMLELPLGTVRSRLFRARMQLREQLKLVMQEE